MTRRIAALLLAAASCALPLTAALAQPATPAGGPAQPAAIVQLLDALPELPADAAQATAWVDKRSELVHPAMLQLHAAIGAHRQFVERIAAANAAHGRHQGAIAGEAMLQGIASEGIDVQRLQRDPAYAQQVQDRLKRMTPAEQMAFAQRINAPLNADRRHVNAAQAIVQDAPAQRAAADAGEAYVRNQPQRFAKAAALWAEADAAVARIKARKLVVAGAARPALEWDNPGCDTRCRAQWDGYAATMLPLMVARESEILAVRRAAIRQQRAAVLAELKTADKLLTAAGYGQASTSQVNQQHIVNYDAAALAEVQALWERTLEAARSAAVVPHCGKQAVLVPQAVCAM